MSKVYIASDHAGFVLKKVLLAYVEKHGFEVEDMGPFEFNPTDDYPDYVESVATAVAAGEATSARGIVIGKSGQGEAMCANRVPGARAAIYYGGTLEVVQLAREHNDANILSLGAGFVNEIEACQAIDLFLNEPFSFDPRHVRRLAKF